MPERRLPNGEPRTGALAAALLLGVSFCVAAPAHAQVGARLAVDSDYRSRGYSVTNAPAVSGALSYDHESGIYASALVIAAVDDADAGFSGYEANLGYAVRVSQRASVEAGVLRTAYARVPGQRLNVKYTEAYAGLTVGKITARVYYSRDYIRKRSETLYGEVQANLSPVRNWNLSLHLGTLTYLNDPPRYTARSRYDWRATVSRTIGKVEIYAGLSGRGPGGDYRARSAGRAVATAGAAISF